MIKNICYIFLAGRIAATNKLPYFKNSLDLVHVWLTSGFQSHTRDCFNKRYSGHWIDKREPTAWPICSSDFNLSDFFIRRQLYRLIRWNPVDSSQDLNYKLALRNPERARGFECHVRDISRVTLEYFSIIRKNQRKMIKSLIWKDCARCLNFRYRMLFFHCQMLLQIQ